MNKLLVVLVASAFALVSASALAADGDTTKPRLPNNQTEDAWLWSTGDFRPKSAWADAKARKEAIAKELAAKRQAELDAKKAGAANNGPNEKRQQYLTEQSKKGSGQ